MKNILYTVLLLLIVPASMSAQSGVECRNVEVNKIGNYVKVDAMVDAGGIELSGNRSLKLIPVLTDGTNSLELKSIVLNGKRRQIVYERNGIEEGNIFSVSGRQNGTGQTIKYADLVEYEDWMGQCRLILREQLCGCANAVIDQNDRQLAQVDLLPPVEYVFNPMFCYVMPEAETVKVRSEQGAAYIDFPVNVTKINADYRNNESELAKIRSTIDAVKNDRDAEITSLAIKGFASPEGGYANNERLAKGRTEALSGYVSGLYSFPTSQIVTSYEAEDWEGLRNCVVQSNLAGREGILKIIDGDLQPDAKEWKIKSTYPEDYRYLLENCYPKLRHCDYRVEFIVRSYSDANEIRRVMAEQPQKLSLQEFYIAANSMEEGSDEFNNVFETAVRMFPDDEVANLNAANSSMVKGDMAAARSYLAKAGDSSEADYARGIYAAIQGDYDSAVSLLEKAEQGGVSQARNALEQIYFIRNH